jgi:hypothetical protein
VEAGVGGAALGVGGGAGQALDVVGEPVEVGRRGALGREGRRLAGDRGAVVGEVAQVVHAEVAQPREQSRLGGLDGRVHERPAVAAAARLDEAGAAQADERLAQGDGGDPELGGELGLARELVAVAEDADADRVRQPPLDLGDPPAAVERREHRVARTRREVARHGGLTDYIWLHRFRAVQPPANGRFRL